MKEGKKIWVESLMTVDEWKQWKKMGYTTGNLAEPPPEFECDFKWRKGMGSHLQKSEITAINDGIEVLRKLLTENQT